MAESLRQLRRNVTQLGLRNALSATASLPIGAQRSVTLAAAAMAGAMLRRKVARNMRLALGQPAPPDAPQRYFRHLGEVLADTLVGFHRGFDATLVPRRLELGATVSVLDDSMAQGRGVIMATPHWVGHELAGGLINRRHPIVMLVREASTPQRTDLKLKWYRSIGVETVLRPRRSSLFDDAMACLRVLRKGGLLAITPDLLAGPGHGVEVALFGRRVSLHGGAIALAVMSGAPLVRTSPTWLSDTHVVLQFALSPVPSEGADREAMIRVGLQDWCDWFEAHLQANPEDWLFWLDKSWSRTLRAVPRTDRTT